MNSITPDLDAMLQNMKTLSDGQTPPSSEFTGSNSKGKFIPPLEKALRAAGFPIRHTTMTSTPEELTGHAAIKEKAYWPRIAGGDALLVLFGDRGPGKTQTATTWAMRRVTELNRSPGKYAKLVDFLGDIKSTWHGGGQSLGTEQDILKRYRTASYLVLDECQEMLGRNFEMQYLVNILDHRYDDQKATVLICNATLDTIHNHLPNSILDRAAETGGLIHFSGPSYRGAQFQEHVKRVTPHQETPQRLANQQPCD